MFYMLSWGGRTGEVILIGFNVYYVFKLHRGQDDYKGGNIVVKRGNKWFDLLPFPDPTNFMVSSNLLESLNENNITGFMAFEVYDNGKQKYYGLQILGKAG